MKILVLNCGSSSIKYQLFDIETKDVLAKGGIEKIGLEGSFIKFNLPNGEKETIFAPIPEHTIGVRMIFDVLTSEKHGAIKSIDEIDAVGHRMVHGGEKFSASTLLTDEVLEVFEACNDLAPLHNPANLKGVNAVKEVAPEMPQVGVFDTAFHQTMPDYAYRYAVPQAWYKELGVRRYGFHGTSHLYVSKRAAAMLGKDAKDCNLITMHIGSGASATAIKNGISVDTSLGLTPLSGLTMGTRPGDLDPGVILYVMEQLGLSPAQMQAHLNKDSGLKGITECYADRRDVEENKSTNDLCRLAIDTEVHNVKKYIGAYMAELGHVDAVVFTAGVGENDDYLRGLFCSGLENLGIKLDKEKNAKTLARLGVDETEISTPDSKVKVFMIPTNEELVIVEDTLAIMNKTYNPNHLLMNYSFAQQQNQK